MNEALQKAIEAAGGPASLARHIGVTTQAVSQWKHAPAKRVRAIESATGGLVSRYELRPDVFGTAPEAATAA